MILLEGPVRAEDHVAVLPGAVFIAHVFANGPP